jgi:hypothetical protein
MLGALFTQKLTPKKLGQIRLIRQGKFTLPLVSQ